jgi:CubicO group peptidase (beta-lactamase class C family)
MRTRRTATCLLLGASASLLLSRSSHAESPPVHAPTGTFPGGSFPGRTFPGRSWETDETAANGYRPELLAAVKGRLSSLPTTSLMVVTGGKVVFHYGDVTEVSYLASARKSILSMLYGKRVAAGTIKLNQTLEELGIDDVGGLLPIEKSATVEDLLTARSGVYHAAGSPGSDSSGTPARGSKRPGTYFYYNNWDFNLAGAVFERLTGSTVFAAFEKDLAIPLQLEDFDPSRQRMLGVEDQSRYLAYHFFLSGRDMARLGLAMVRNGTWQGQQIIPADWVKASTTPRVPAADITGPLKDGPLDYGYLWWLPNQKRGPEWARSFLAYGNYGQFILGLPALDTVIVHRRAVSDDFAIARNLGRDLSSPTGVSVPQFLAIADAILAARSV